MAIFNSYVKLPEGNCDYSPVGWSSKYDENMSQAKGPKGAIYRWFRSQGQIADLVVTIAMYRGNHYWWR